MVMFYFSKTKITKRAETSEKFQPIFYVDCKSFTGQQ